MESENINEEVAVDNVNQETEKNVLHKVTPLSKYLALVLFIAMSFIGGWIGYNYAPEKVVRSYI